MQLMTRVKKKRDWISDSLQIAREQRIDWHGKCHHSDSITSMSTVDKRNRNVAMSESILHFGTYFDYGQPI